MNKKKQATWLAFLFNQYVVLMQLLVKFVL